MSSVSRSHVAAQSVPLFYTSALQRLDCVRYASEMRNPSRLQEKVHNVQETLPEDETLEAHVKVSNMFDPTRPARRCEQQPPARHRQLTDARTMSGVSAQPILDLHHQLSTPPTVRARVKEGTLYMPIIYEGECVSTLSASLSQHTRTSSYQLRRRCLPGSATATCSWDRGVS